MITLPGEVDGYRVRVGCDVVAIDDVQDSLAAFGDRYLRKIFTASEINDCQGRDRVHRLAARFAAKEAVIKAFTEPDMPLSTANIPSLFAFYIFGQTASVMLPTYHSYSTY